MSLADHHKRLIYAILARAARDAHEGNGHAAEARRWLAGPEARDLLDLAELPRDRVTEWLGGLDPVRQPVLGL